MGGDQIFTAILERVGAQGTYQPWHLLLANVIAFTFGSSCFFNPFLFHQDGYLCPASISSCQQHVCSLPPD